MGMALGMIGVTMIKGCASQCGGPHNPRNMCEMDIDQLERELG